MCLLIYYSHFAAEIQNSNQATTSSATTSLAGAQDNGQKTTSAAETSSAGTQNGQATESGRRCSNVGRFILDRLNQYENNNEMN